MFTVYSCKLPCRLELMKRNSMKYILLPGPGTGNSVFSFLDQQQKGAEPDTASLLRVVAKIGFPRRNFSLQNYGHRRSGAFSSCRVGRVCHLLVKGKDATSAAVGRAQLLQFHNRVVCRTLYQTGNRTLIRSHKPLGHMSSRQ